MQGAAHRVATSPGELGALSPDEVAPIDVAVIGAGPGGAACALTCAELGLSVALFDPRLDAARRHHTKPCGEGLMPAGADTLQRLGLDPTQLGRGFAGVRYCAPHGSPLEVDFALPGIAIHRGVLQAALDERLARAPGVERVAGVARCERSEDAVGAGFRVSAGARVVRARVLVAADGGAGRAASWLRVGVDAGRRERERGRTGLRVHCELRRPLDRVEVHLGGGCEVYLTPLAPMSEHPRGLVNVALLFDHLPGEVRGGEALLAHALARHPRAADLIGAAVGPIEARALDWPHPRRVAEAGAFLVGDAGGGVDPVLGCGTTVALRTGVAAAWSARALCDGAAPRAVARAYERVHARETTARRRVAALLMLAARRPWRLRALVAAARALPAVTRWLARQATRVEPLGQGSSAQGAG